MPEIDDDLNLREEALEEDTALYHPPIAELGYHKFVESEYADRAEGAKGRCDTCGGGPLAEIHQKPVDQLERIGDLLGDICAALEQSIVERRKDSAALERIAVAMEHINVGLDHVGYQLGRIAQAQGFSFGNVLGWLIWMVICGGAGVWIGMHLR